MADLDLFVIGGGSGGVRAARIAAEAGARVALAEEYRMGGTCVIRGCVPKKLMVIASQFRDAFEDAPGFGWDLPAPPRFHWDRLTAALAREVARLEQAYTDTLQGRGVAIHKARAEIVDPHRVRLSDGSEHRADHILIATGGRPWLPDIPGADLGITSNDIFTLPEQPARVLVVGGGYVGCEFAGILNGLGSDVVQWYRGAQILRGFDREIRDHVADAMRARGIDLCCGRDLVAIERVEGGLRATADDGSAVVVDQVLLATGRVPNSAGLGLEAAGVRLGPSGRVEVDAWSQTAVPSIYAVGDVTDRVALTPVAIREGQAFAETVFRANPTRPDHALIPTAVFTQPEIGTVGLSEEDAAQRGETQIFRARFRPMANTLAGRDEKMVMKLIVEARSRKVLGCHIAGHGAGEMIQLAAIAIGMGATKEDFDRTMAVHPTAAEELVTMRSPAA